MGDGHWAFGRRVVVEDVRRDDTFLRVTWHDEAKVFVVSHWRGEVCIAATRVPVDAAPDLVTLFVRGLAESAGAAAPPAATARRESLLGRARRLLSQRLRHAA